jgi:PAS domain S-box-containing protein
MNKPGEKRNTKNNKTSAELNEGRRDVSQVINQAKTVVLERRPIEDDLTASEVRYRRLFETAQDGILIIDAESEEIKDVNPFLSEMLGYDKEHFLGKRLWEIGFFKDISASRQAFSELQANGFIRYEDLPLETRDGRSIDVEFVSNVYTVNGDKVIQCNIRDITERKKAEAALVKAKKNLETKVKKRTAMLSRANMQLRFYAAEVIRAHEDERKHVACELHDEIGQSLTSLKLMMNQAASSHSTESNSILREAQTVVSELMRQVREMSLDLRPSMLDDLGLLPALLWHIQRYTAQTRVKVDFQHSGLNLGFSPDISIAVYRIMQEALTNVARHAGVNMANVHVWADERAINLVIKDLGSGFNVSSLPAGASTGLSGMRERAFLLGGSFHVESSPEKGTNLKAQIPLAKSNLMNAQAAKNMGKDSRRQNKVEEELTRQPGPISS